jgi:opacity protein-like surface antigen
MRKLLVAGFILLIAAAPAMAQDERPVTVNLGGGAAFPVSGLRDSFNTGFNGAIGATFNFTPRLGFQGEYQYDWMPGPDKTIDVSNVPGGVATSTGLLESHHKMHVGDFNLVYTPDTHGGAFGGYVLGGLGVYHRTIAVTTPSVGFATVCDPYWLVCYPAAVEVDRIVGDRSSTDFGIDFGGGVTFGHAAKFYVEMRYHYVWGPKVPGQIRNGDGTLSPSGETFSTNAQYFPLTFGVRF